MEKIRESVISGSWYPGSRDSLLRQLSGFFEKADRKEEGIRALIAPHAGYAYSGGVAACSFKQVEGGRYRRVFVLAPSHQYPLRGASVPDFSHYRTPLGLVPVSGLADKIRGSLDFIGFYPEAHVQEHALEIELPFLQYALKDFEVIPILVGSLSGHEIDLFSDLLLGYLDEETLLVASSDLSHYLQYDEAASLDRDCIESIVSLDMDRAARSEMCGLFPVLVLMSVAKKLNWRPSLLEYQNSGDVTGDRSRVVGYAAVGFYSGEGLGDGQGRKLLDIARKSIELYVRDGRVYEPETEDPLLLDEGAVFVTLEKEGLLRGCIGHLEADRPLYLDVRDNAISAAVRDPRFRPVASEELGDLEIEVSVLTKPAPLNVSDPREYLERIRPGVDGLILECSKRAATYLPQVWDVIPDPEEFLSSLCEKAGLPGNCWLKDPVRIYRYQVKAFKE